MKRFFNKKYIRIGATIAVLCFLVCAPLVVFGQAPEPKAAPAWWDVGGQITSAIGNIFSTLIAYMGAFALMVTGWILWLAGALLTEVMKYTVVNMSDNIEGISSIRVAWTVFRDIANMFFIFILLYSAIRTILGIADGSAKKVITHVVIVALLINFSLFFTKVIIDSSNILTIGFYNKILDSGGGENGLAGPFMTKMGMVGMFDLEGIVGDQGALSTKNKTFTQIAMTGFMGSIFILVAAFVFLAANIMFIGRFVILIFLMILSPLAFAAMALPKDKYSDQWWTALINQAVFAPAFLAMMYATLLVLEGIEKPTGQFTDAFRGNGTGAPDQGAVQVIMNYIVIIVMIVACLIIAKKFGAYGADKAMKRVEKMRDWGVGRLGRGALRATGVAALDRKFADSEFSKTRTGNFLRGMTTGAITGSKIGGKSIQTVDKADKKMEEEYNKTVAKNVEKTFEKNLGTRRTDKFDGETKAKDALITKNKDEQEVDARALREAEYGSIEADVLRKEVAELEGNLNDLAPDKDVFANTASAAQKQEFKRMTDALTSKRSDLGRVMQPFVAKAAPIKKRMSDREAQIKKLEAEKETLKKNFEANKGRSATKDEKKEWLNPMYEERAKALERPSIVGSAIKTALPTFAKSAPGLSRVTKSLYGVEFGIKQKEGAVKELRKKARGEDTKDKKQNIKDLAKDLGVDLGSEEKEGGDSEGEDKGKDKE